MGLNYKSLDIKLSNLKNNVEDKQLYSYKNMDDLNILMTYHSNALEGNTLSLYETKLIFSGVSVGDKSLREIYEASNHIKAFKHLWNLRNQPDIIINERDILSINSIILENIIENRGKYRKHHVQILGSDVQLANPNSIDALMKDFDNWLEQAQKNKNIHPLEIASKAHYKLVKIHPFEDGNGRTSRLLMNAVLIKYNFPPIIIEINERNQYLTALQKTDASNDLAIFDDFIYKKMDKILNNYIAKYVQQNLKNISTKKSLN